MNYLKKFCSFDLSMNDYAIYKRQLSKLGISIYDIQENLKCFMEGEVIQRYFQGNAIARSDEQVIINYVKSLLVRKIEN